MAQQLNYGTGRRKTSTARVFLNPGNGSITVHGRPLDKFFGRETARRVVRQPLVVTEMADKVAVMYAGRIVEEGTHRELLRAGGLYARYWERQSGGFLNYREAAE